MKEEILKKLGDKLIRDAEQCGNTKGSWYVLFHEVERPECLKRLDQERMQETDKKIK